MTDADLEKKVAEAVNKVKTVQTNTEDVVIENNKINALTQLMGLTITKGFDLASPVFSELMKAFVSQVVPHVLPVVQAALQQQQPQAQPQVQTPPPAQIKPVEFNVSQQVQQETPKPRVELSKEDQKILDDLRKTIK